jgi:4a-hydroxytetrahydrobiopterin dehydratase
MEIHPMANLSQLKCVACRGGEPPLTETEIAVLQPQISEWQITEVNGIQRLVRIFKFKNFVEALAFTNQIGAIAEAEDHHPMLITEYGRVTVHWWTHLVKGLHKNDFIMAAKTDQIFGN